MGKGRIVTKKNVPEKKWKEYNDPYWVEVNGSPVDKVPLQKSREVKLEPHTRRSRRPDYGERHKVKSARSNPDRQTNESFQGKFHDRHTLNMSFNRVPL